MLVTQFDKFVNRSTQEILGSEIEQENLEPMLSTDIPRSVGDVTGVKGEKEVYYRTGNVNLTSTDIGALNEENVYNGLDKTEAGYALDARQGKALDEAIDDKLDKAKVYNGLDQTEAGYALDARQGKMLNDHINAIQQSLAIKYYDINLGGTQITLPENGAYYRDKIDTGIPIPENFEYLCSCPAGAWSVGVFINAVGRNTAGNLSVSVSSFASLTLPSPRLFRVFYILT